MRLRHGIFPSQLFVGGDFASGKQESLQRCVTSNIRECVCECVERPTCVLFPFPNFLEASRIDSKAGLGKKRSSQFAATPEYCELFSNAPHGIPFLFGDVSYLDPV